MHINQDETQPQIDHLMCHTIISDFIDHRLDNASQIIWLALINAKFVGEDAVRMQQVGRGFFNLTIENLDVIGQLLMSSSHKSYMGVCVMQPWVPRFNLDT